MTVCDMLPKTGPTHDLATVTAWYVEMRVISVEQTFCKETNSMLTERTFLTMDIKAKYFISK
jgi:hypothetical protein